MCNKNSYNDFVKFGIKEKGDGMDKMKRVQVRPKLRLYMYL